MPASPTNWIPANAGMTAFIGCGNFSQPLSFPLIALIALALTTPALAHHGVAGVGGAAIEGPGAPIESASSAVLPAGSTLAVIKLDHAKFKRVDTTQSEADYSRFTMLGVGHGFTPWFSAYVFAPYNEKIDTPNPAGGPTYNTRGWADYSVMGQLGFKYEPGQGFKLTPANESLDDLEDWHFSAFAGATIPHGNPNLRDSTGAIDAGKSTGFGKSSYSLGLTMSKMLTRDLTLSVEASALRFREYTYADASTMKFGSEDRLNAALAYRMFGDAARKLRVDGVLEMQYLALGQDKANGSGDPDTGGKIFYLMPGVRIYKDNMSFALGLKKVVSARLNELTSPQQGAEGKEKYRVIFSASTLF
jgi:hypothetical protein